jgi:hypothetical protein
MAVSRRAAPVAKLIGEEIRTVTGAFNIVLAVQDGIALVGAGRSPQGQPVSIQPIHGW